MPVTSAHHWNLYKKWQLTSCKQYVYSIFTWSGMGVLWGARWWGGWQRGNPSKITRAHKIQTSSTASSTRDIEWWARADIKFVLRAPRILENTTGEQRALRKFSPSNKTLFSNVVQFIRMRIVVWVAHPHHAILLRASNWTLQPDSSEFGTMQRNIYFESSRNRACKQLRKFASASKRGVV